MSASYQCEIKLISRAEVQKGERIYSLFLGSLVPWLASNEYAEAFHPDLAARLNPRPGKILSCFLYTVNGLCPICKQHMLWTRLWTIQQIHEWQRHGILRAQNRSPFCEWMNGKVSQIVVSLDNRQWVSPLSWHFWGANPERHLRYTFTTGAEQLCL